MKTSLEHSGVSDAWADKAVTGVVGRSYLHMIQEGQPTDWRQVIDTSLRARRTFAAREKNKLFHPFTTE